MDIKVVAKSIGLSEDATEEQVTAKLAELNARPAVAPVPTDKPADTNIDLVRTLSEQVVEMQRRELTGRVATLIDDGVKAGKLMLAEKEKLSKWALSDFEGCAEYIEARPKLSLFDANGIGSDHAAPEGPTLGAGAAIALKQLGVRADPATLTEYKPLAERLDEAKDKIGSTALAVAR